MMQIHASNLNKIRDLLSRRLPKPLKFILIYFLKVIQRSRFVGFFLPKLNSIESCDTFLPNRKTILIVSHEGSRTGAPMVGYNLIVGFAKQYNIVALFLGPGPLINASKLPGVVVVGPLFVQGSVFFSEIAIRKIARKVKLEFAIINSIESRSVLPALMLQQVPTISLIHEFASNTLPMEAFSDAISWSDQTVFSARITLNNMLEKFPDLGFRSYAVIPQGRCTLPPDSLESNYKLTLEADRVKLLMRPKGFAKDGIVIVGVGYVQYRKGVDLFLQCAEKVLHMAPDKNFRFIWVGKGYSPKADLNYSVYLSDQITRAGLENHVQFVGELHSLDIVYETADIFVLSSRLDPLPNVAIDAMTSNLPVICFENTTGIAEILIDAGLGDSCVADYIDINDMALKVIYCAESEDLRIRLGKVSAKLASNIFNMDSYIKKIEHLALAQVARVHQNFLDAEMIFNSKLIKWDFYNSPSWSVKSRNLEATRSFIRSWKSNIGQRKPFPGFHPGIYREAHGIQVPDSDPFADYLRSGQPQGIWNSEIISSGDISEPKEVLIRVGLHIHVYYTELLPEILDRLSFNILRPELLISVTSESDRLIAAKYLSNYKFNVFYINVVPNLGRDIGPFLTEFRDLIQENYDIIGHLHTKKTVDVSDTSTIKIWYKFLLGNLLGSKSEFMADAIISRMIEDESIGIVFPDDPNAIGWSENKLLAQRYAEKLGVKDLADNFIFPIGSMFWARVSALEPLFNLKLNWLDYPEEPLPYDGTMLHAIERLFSVVLSLGEYRIATTYVTGLTR